MNLEQFVERGMAAQRAADEAIAASACTEKWYDEDGCENADGVHRCREHGSHDTHRCGSCSSFVLERHLEDGS